MTVSLLISEHPQENLPLVPALVAGAGERASLRLLEFFATNTRSPYTRRAYYPAAEESSPGVRPRPGLVADRDLTI